MRNEAERELVREAATRVLAGEGLMTIARDWNGRGLPGATEHCWTAPTLRKALLSARVAGLREHGADPSGKVLGALTRANWDGAIDRHTWDQVRSVLLNPERLTLRHTEEVPADGLDLLRGLRRPHALPPAWGPYEALRLRRSPRGHHLAILAEPVDDLVASRVLGLLTTPAFREALLAQSGRIDDGSLGRALAELGSARSRLQTLDDDYYVRGVVDLRRYRSIRTRLEREVARLHAAVDGTSRQRIVLHPDPLQLWKEADFGQRRDLVRLIVKRVQVAPARRGARFDSSRVKLQIPVLDAEPPLSGRNLRARFLQ